MIAFGKGGATETVLDYNNGRGGRSVSESTGLFFNEPTPEALSSCVERAEALNFDPIFIQNHARKFNRDRFKKEMRDVLERFGVPLAARTVVLQSK